MVRDSFETSQLFLVDIHAVELAQAILIPGGLWLLLAICFPSLSFQQVVNFGFHCLVPLRWCRSWATLCTSRVGRGRYLKRGVLLIVVVLYRLSSFSPVVQDRVHVLLLKGDGEVPSVPTWSPAGPGVQILYALAYASVPCPTRGNIEEIRMGHYAIGFIEFKNYSTDLYMIKSAIYKSKLFTSH